MAAPQNNGAGGSDGKEDSDPSSENFPLSPQAISPRAATQSSEQEASSEAVRSKPPQKTLSTDLEKLSLCHTTNSNTSGEVHPAIPVVGSNSNSIENSIGNERYSSVNASVSTGSAELNTDVQIDGVLVMQRNAEIDHLSQLPSGCADTEEYSQEEISNHTSYVSSIPSSNSVSSIPSSNTNLLLQHVARKPQPDNSSNETTVEPVEVTNNSNTTNLHHSAPHDNQPSSSSPHNKPIPHTCYQCKTERISTVLLDCTHLCVCKKCADHLITTKGVCPYKEVDKDGKIHNECRKPVLKILPVIVPK